MSLTADDINAVRAQWEEWVPDVMFTLSMEVRAAEVAMGVDAGHESRGELVARFEAEALYVQVEIRKWGDVLFTERIPHDARALKASVQALARKIAQWNDEQAASSG